MKKRIFIIFSSLVLIGVITTGILSLSFQRMIHLKSLEDKLNSNSILIKELVEKENMENMDLNLLAKEYSKSIDVRVTFFDGKGNVVGDSTVEKKDEDVKDVLSISIPIDNKEINISKLRLSVDSNNIDDLNKKFMKYLVISIFAGLIVAFLIGLRYIEHASDPYKELIEATKNISYGNYGEKVSLQQDDELGALANSFNNMSVKLDDTIKKLQESNTKLKATLTSVVDGLIALDNNFNLILFNPAAEKIFGIEGQKIMGKNILDVFLEDKTYKIFEGLTSNETIWEKEMEIYSPEYRVLNVYANPIILNNDPTRKLGMVYLFQDVTKVKKLERVREDFVANVSHELKTPLTSIKGFIETLKDGAIEDENVSYKFLDIIDVEVDRLNCLVDDLLLLSEIENKNSNTVYEYFNVEEIIDNLFQVLNKIAKEKNIILEKEIEENIPQLYGSYNHFRQMLMNLIDNGIKYTPNGGKVKVSVFEKDEKLVIKVKDTGIGIDKKHQNRLFERFYRADKARSRQVGGTGLGLAIVKHIVLMFNGKIDLQSEPNRGSIFTIEIPLDEKGLDKLVDIEDKN
ncbi:two-component system histidine kinase PnpS [Anaerosalibacter bizertensis]|uniref:two-component system histidine kinase PnpS n=1 Tax=Anaerosalibacter bizertensis TaxID=932217 RepID=UPI001D012AB1|nr:ATP-binding protein [Anaerosalibacter bizertensis]MBV1817816.1 cell wall metabolism sensor histidine kinase WalK [Bacteroidales bacterium MSK.15.36]MCB5559183.1 cell wall metabolism sensor histidine kinase WalK [Anaerosalibacter bizertensis]